MPVQTLSGKIYHLFGCFGKLLGGFLQGRVGVVFIPGVAINS
jgi:hypothetical protein